MSKKLRATSVLPLCLLPLLLLAGCVGFSSVPAAQPPDEGGNNSGSNNGGNTPAKASKFIYGIEGFEIVGPFGGVIDSSTGKVTPISHDLFDAGLGDSNLAIIAADPKGRFIYLLKYQAFSAQIALGQSGIGIFRVDRNTGALSIPPGGPVVFTEANFGGIAVDGKGRFLYQPNGFPNKANTQFDVYSIDQSTGSLARMAAAPLHPVGPFILASPDGHFLFNSGPATKSEPGMVQTLAINSQNGQLTPIGPPISTGGSSGPMTVADDMKFLFVTNWYDQTIAVFTIGTNGTLTPVSGSPFPVTAGSLQITPNGKFLYTLSEGTDLVPTVRGFTVNAATGELTAIPDAVVRNVVSLTVDLSGHFAYLTGADGGAGMTTYRIDPGTGALSNTGNTTLQPWADTSDRMVTIP